MNITLIANYTGNIEWLEFEGVESENNNENDNDASDDPALARQRIDCDDVNPCAKVIAINPTIEGRYTLRARGRGTDGVRSDWFTTTLRVRAGGATSTPTATGAATATATTAAPAPTDTPTPAASPAP